MKVLFAGCGDIGVRAIRQIQQKIPSLNWEYLAVRRNTSRLPVDITSVSGDIRDTKFLASLLASEQFTALVVSLTPEQMTDEGYRESYVVAARSIQTAVAQCTEPPHLVIWISSTGVYGESDGEWVDEQTLIIPSSFRGKRLREAEEVIAGLSVPSSIVRFSGIYGSGRHRLMNQVRDSHCVPATPVVWTNRIHSEDCAGFIVHLLQQFVSGCKLENQYIATDNEPAKRYEVQQWLAQEIGVDHDEGAAVSHTVDSLESKYLMGEIKSGAKEDKAKVIKSPAGNRRCRNQRMRATGYQLKYPSYREGYRALLLEGSSSI